MWHYALYTVYLVIQYIAIPSVNTTRIIFKTDYTDYIQIKIFADMFYILIYF